MGISSPRQVVHPSVKVPADDIAAKVNLSGYLDLKFRTLPGFGRGIPGTSVWIGEQQVPILIATADTASHGLGAFGGDDDLIKAEESHHEDSHEGNGHQKIQQAGLQNGIVHKEFQDEVLFE